MMFNVKVLSTMNVLTWMGLIFYFSHQAGQDSSALSGSFITLLENFFNRDLNFFHTPLRKSAHMGVYFILGAFLVDMLSHYTPNRRGIILLSLSISLLYAVSDEFHQTFIPGRSGEITDVLFDFIGASFGVMFMYIAKVTVKDPVFKPLKSNND